MQAGYEVTAIDGFADVQTVALCKHVVAVHFDAQGFRADAILGVLQALDLSQFEGLVYGSGFEAQPELLHQFGKMMPLLGNPGAVVAEVKNPSTFFAALEQHQISHPDWYLNKPEKRDNLLLKGVGHSGGEHIQFANFTPDVRSQAHYFQQQLEGEAVSILFIANGQQIDVVGFNLQWTSPIAHAPFRFGGAAGMAELPESVKFQLVYAAETLTQHFGLLGLNSLDAIFRKDDGEQVFVLELNPRLSATVDLYHDVRDHWFEHHIRSCLEKTLQAPTAIPRKSNALAVVYADEDMLINTDFVWPVWVKDNPQLGKHGVKIKSGEPVCTVHGCAVNAWLAKQWVLQLSAMLLKQLKQQNKSLINTES